MARWKYERREERKQAKLKLSQRQKNNKPNNLSKKDEYTVKGYKDGDPNNEFELVVSAASFHGHPKEYDDIKAKCVKKYDCRINILEIVTK